MIAQPLPRAPADANATIAGLSAAPGSPLCLLRLSGPRAVAVAGRIFRGQLRAARRPTFGHLVDPRTGTVLDEALGTVFVAPRSYTREDVVEIAIRGGPALTERALALAVAAGARPARPGEFTRRAFAHGRIDLLQAEGILAMMAARDPAGLERAGALVAGRASKEVRHAEVGIARALQYLDAASDYPLEASGDVSVEDLAADLRSVQHTLAGLGSNPLLSSSSDKTLIPAAAQHLRAALDAVDDGLPSEAVVGALLRARHALGRLTGATASAADLDAFFNRFPAGS